MEQLVNLDLAQPGVLLLGPCFLWSSNVEHWGLLVHVQECWLGLQRELRVSQVLRQRLCLLS